MGRDNNNAGMHLSPNGYRYATDSVDSVDAYGVIIAESSIKKQVGSTKTINKEAKAIVKKPVK